MNPNAPSPQPFDCIIAGGGIGAFLAYTIASPTCSVALVDPIPTPTVQGENFDARSLALSQSTIRILKGLKLWDAVADRASPVRFIHTSKRGAFGATRMRAGKHKVEMFGATLELQALYSTIRERVENHPHITNFCPGKVTHFELDRPLNRVTVETASGETRTLTGKLLVGADGNRSFVRETLKIPMERQPYHQHAIVANVGLAQHHDDRAFERFIPEGVIALLPLREKRSALIHTTPSSEVEKLMALDEASYLHHIQKNFGYRLGKLTRMGKRTAFPLERAVAEEQIRPGMVLLGNSAHILHPVAGQGFNLALRDMAALAETIQNALAAHQNPGDLPLLEQYLAGRKQNQKVILNFTHRLIQYLTQGNAPMTLLSSLGFTALDKLPPLKKRLSRIPMGLSNPQSDLVRGVFHHE